MLSEQQQPLSSGTESGQKIESDFFGTISPLVAEITKYNICAEGELERLDKLILQRPEDVNGVSKSAYFGTITPLMAAVINGKIEVVKKLLEKGAKKTINEALLKKLEKQDKTALMAALEGEQSKTPLMAAIEGEQTEIAVALIRAGANVNSVNSKGQTPLMAAIEGEQTEIAVALIQAGAKVNQVDRSGRALLHMAVTDENTEMVSKLIDAGLDVNLATFEQIISLRSYPIANSVESLINANPRQINQVGNDGKTPLHMVVCWGCEESVKALLNAGAEVDSVDSKGITPLLMALEQNHTEIAAALVIAGAKVKKDDLKKILSKTAINFDSISKFQRIKTYTGLITEICENHGATLDESQEFSTMLCEALLPRISEEKLNFVFSLTIHTALKKLGEMIKNDGIEKSMAELRGIVANNSQHRSLSDNALLKGMFPSSSCLPTDRRTKPTKSATFTGPASQKVEPVSKLPKDVSQPRDIFNTFNPFEIEGYNEPDRVSHTWPCHSHGQRYRSIGSK